MEQVFTDCDHDDESSCPTLQSGSDSVCGDDSSVESIDYCDIKTVDVPSFDEVAVTRSVIPPAILHALFALPHELNVRSMSVPEFYESLDANSVLLGNSLPPRAHVDGGAIATATHRKDYLWAHHDFTESELASAPFLKVADDTLHKPTGCGFLKVPCEKSAQQFFVKSFCTPQIPAAMLSPHVMAKSFGCDGCGTYSNIVNDTAKLALTNCAANSGDVSLHLTLIRGLLFTDHLIAPAPREHVSTSLPEASTVSDAEQCLLPVHSTTCCRGDSAVTAPVRALSSQQQQALWHLRLGHVNDRAVADLHHHVDGVPALSRGDALHRCPMCARAKLHKSNRGHAQPRRAEFCWQHIQIDFGFFVVKSSGKKPSNRRVRESKRISAIAPRDESADPVHVGALTRSARARRTAATTDKSTPKPTVPLSVPAPRPQVETVREDDDDEPSAPPAVPQLPATQQKYSLEALIGHQGPLSSSDKRCKGSPFNLKVRWSTKETTWEPLPNLFQDVPRMVVECARKHSLLDNPHWSAVRDLALSPSCDEDAQDSVFDMDDDDDLPDAEGFDIEFVPLSEAEAFAKSNAAANRCKRLVGVNGETCYCLITDLKTGSWKASIRRDKAPPLDFFQSFISRYAPTCGERTVRFDQGGELGNSTAVRELFEKAGHDVQTTSPDSSSEIGQVERPHRTIGDGARTMLFGAGLPANYWPYALSYFILIANCIARGDRPAPPVTMCTGRRVNLSLLKIFGSRICALPTEKRDAKVDVHARSGIFLGFKRTMRKAYYLDDVTKRVKTARHVAFDEGWNDSLDPPPYVRYLKGDSDLETVHLDDTTAAMDISLSPFNKTMVVDTPFHPLRGAPLGFQVEQCPKHFRAYVSAFTRAFGPHSKDSSNKKFLGAYVLRIGDHHIFSVADVQSAIRHCSAMKNPPVRLPILLALDERARLSESRPPPLHLRPVDIRRIAALPLVAGEGGSPQEQRRRLRELAATPLMDATPPDPDDLIHYSPEELLEMHKLVNEHMTPEERNLKSFTRKNLEKYLTPENFQLWKEADRKQLDSHFDAGTIGHPVERPKASPMKPSQVFRVVWARLVKANGVRKARACLDGSKRAAPWLRNMVQTYSSCIELPCLRTFVGTCVNRECRMHFGDVDNAHQQSPPPSVDCFLEIDDTIADWYFHRFGIELDRQRQVIPLHRALQGHPEAGVLWERMANDILINKMKFKNTAHERNLYQGLIDGKEVLACRQVDDFSIGCKSEETAKEFFRILRQHVETECNAMGKDVPDVGVCERHNGIDIAQTRDCVKVGCESHIDRLLQSHGWDAPSSKDPVNPVPLNPATANALSLLEGPPDKSDEAKELARTNGFSYRNVLGELICAFVICRLDIGCAVCFLARFADCPHQEHFAALKQVCKCLRATESWGIVFERPKPMDDLPNIPFDFLEKHPNLPDFPDFPQDSIACCLDAAHAANLKNR